MGEHKITCVCRLSRGNTHENITHVRNLEKKWRISREEIISQIEGRIHQYYVIDPVTGTECSVDVVKEPGKPAYLRAQAQGQWNDTLLAQPEWRIRPQV